MRCAIIADVHANLEALDAVLRDIRKRKVEAILFLGDAAGYGPNPNECIEVLRRETSAFIAGNHDWAAVELTDITYFNPYARAAIEWTAEILSNQNRTFLKNLPLTESYIPDTIFLVHATPREPEQWHYFINLQDADMNFRCFKEKICFLGHSHQPAIIEQLPGGGLLEYRDTADIKDKHRYIINAGSVGQPRDGNPDAAYALFDKNCVEIRRVSYDIVSTQRKMREYNLPSFLIERLARGL